MTHEQEWIDALVVVLESIDRGYTILDPNGYGRWYLMGEKARREFTDEAQNG